MERLKQIKNWEYTTDRISYYGEDGETHMYLLDFKIFTNDNNFYYIETKGYQTDKDVLKWKSVRDHGYKLVIWFEDEIIQQEVIVAKMVKVPD